MTDFFSAEVTDLIYAAQIMNTTNVKGAYLWSEYATMWMDKITNEFKSAFLDHTDLRIPVLSNKVLLKYERQLAGNHFDEAMYQCGEYYLKPTSEISLYDSNYFRNKLKSKKQLPLHILAIGNAYRKESRTAPFIRVTEINYFIEGHSTFVTETANVKYIQEVKRRYKRFFKNIGIPYLQLLRPAHDTFVGAKYTWAYDTVFSNGRRLQVGTIHDLSDNYAKIMDLRYLSKSYIYQCTYGITERVLGAILYHGYTPDKFLLPSFLRLQELIVYAEYLEQQHYRRYDKVHVIMNGAHYKKVLQSAIKRDSIIFIMRQKEVEEGVVVVIDRGYTEKYEVNDVHNYTSEGKDVVYSLGPITRVTPTVGVISPKEEWGTDGTNVYGGPSY